MPTIYTTVGSNVSVGFALPRSDRAVYVEVPSLTAASEIRFRTSPVSGGPYVHTLMRSDGTGLPYAAHSGAGPAIGGAFLPHPFAVIALTGSVTAVTTFALYC